MAGYVIGPNVAIRLARDKAVIRHDIRSWLRRFYAPRCYRFSTRQYAAVR